MKGKMDCGMGEGKAGQVAGQGRGQGTAVIETVRNKAGMIAQRVFGDAVFENPMGLRASGERLRPKMGHSQYVEISPAGSTGKDTRVTISGQWVRAREPEAHTQTNFCGYAGLS